MAKTSQPKKSKSRLKAQLSKEIEARLSAFVNSSTEGFALLDENLNYIFINPTAERMIGVSKEAVVGKNILDIVPNIKESGRYDKYLNVLKTGGAFHIDDMVSHTKFRDIHASLKAFRVESWLGLVFTDITELKQAEELLRESEERFRNVLNNSLDMIYSFNVKTVRYEYVSPASGKILGYSPEELIGPGLEKTRAIIHPDDLGRLYENTLELLSSKEGTASSIEYRVKRKELEYRWVSDSRSVVYDDRNEPLAIVGSLRDITERKKADEILRQSEQNYRVLFEGTLDGLFVVSAETGRIVLANRSAAKMFGFSSPEAMIGVYPINFVTPENRNGVLRFVAEDVLRDLSEEWSRSNRRVNEIRALANDGREIWLEIQGTPTEYQGKLAYLVSSKDITERKQVEEALGESEEKYRDLFNSAQVGLFRSRIADGTILECSDLLAKMFGYQNREECIARHITSEHYVDPNVRAQELAQMLEKGKVENLEALVTRKDGSPFWISYSATIYPERDYIEGVIIDITERKKAEEALHFTRFALDSTTDTMACINKDARFIDVNDAFCRAVGYSREELLSMTVHDIDPNYSAKIWSEFWEKLKQSGSLTFESCHRTKDGKVFPVEVTVTFFEYKGKEYHCGFAHDITERKRAEERIRTYERIIKTVKNLMSFIDRNYIYIAVNDAYLKIFGKSEEEIVGHKVEELMGKEVFAEQIKSQLDRCLNGEVVHTEDWFTFPTIGKRFMETDSYPMEVDGVVSGAIVHVADITERKRMEEALHQSEQTIRRLAKAAASAHEEERHRVSLEVHDRISQTLTGAFHQLQALESIPIENTEAQQILKRASDLLQESIRESRNIMEDLYSPVLSDFGIVAVIDEELRRFQEETGCRTKFEKRCAVRPTPEVELTVYRIFREALANIKRHAIGATEVRVSLSDKAEMVSLQVKDNGPGFDVESAMLNMRVGGLKGMQRRVELGGGTFEIVSSRGHGTTVSVSLPCTSASDGGKEEKTT